MLAWWVCDVVVDENCYCEGFKLVTKELQLQVTHTKIKSWGTGETARSKSYYLEMKAKLTVSKNGECFWKSKQHPTNVDHVSEDLSPECRLAGSNHTVMVICLLCSASVSHMPD